MITRAAIPYRGVTDDVGTLSGTGADPYRSAPAGNMTPRGSSQGCLTADISVVLRVSSTPRFALCLHFTPPASIGGGREGYKTKRPDTSSARKGGSLRMYGAGNPHRVRIRPQSPAGPDGKAALCRSRWCSAHLEAVVVATEVEGVEVALRQVEAQHLRCPTRVTERRRPPSGSPPLTEPHQPRVFPPKLNIR